MDEIQPVIVAEEWIGTRFDCGNEYTMGIQLFRQNSDEPVDQKTCTVITLGGGIGAWRRVCFSLRNYSKGVRRIRFLRKGQDNQFWAGYYGTKFSLPRVYLQLPRYH